MTILVQHERKSRKARNETARRQSRMEESGAALRADVDTARAAVKDAEKKVRAVVAANARADNKLFKLCVNKLPPELQNIWETSEYVSFPITHNVYPWRCERTEQSYNR
eukprot:1821187-Rhodomonas_salina.1